MKQQTHKQKISCKQKSVNRIVTDMKANYRGEEIQTVLIRARNYGFFFSLTTYVAPIFITIASLLITNCLDLKEWIEITAQVAIMVLAVGFGIFLGYKETIYTSAASVLKKDSQVKNTKIKELLNTVKEKDGDINFLMSLLNNLGKHIARGESTIFALANHLAVEIYHDCMRRFGDEFEVTVNIYEKKKKKLTMIGHQQVSPYSDAPALYLSGETGMQINDDTIKDFYCVECIEGKNDINCISDWKKIIDAFKWHDADKNEIKKSKEACRKAGFTYNQYISCRYSFDRNNEHAMLLEIITHNESIIDTDIRIEKTARWLFSLYMPLISMLTTIAADRETVAGQAQ